MAQGQLATAFQQIRKLLGAQQTFGATDRQLLDRFVRQREEAAFAALVQRHGALVLGVCRRVLSDVHAAEDAFQATFLVLARRAGAIRWQDSVGGWLFAVAQRVARRAKADTDRRQAQERRAADMSGANPPADPIDTTETGDPVQAAARQEVRSLLEAELQRLPEKYRTPLVLCYLEGKTHEEAAQELGWPVGSMSRHVTRGRELLRQRLSHRGVALSVAALGGVLTETAAAAVPAALADRTVQAAIRFAAGQAAAAGILSSEAVVLAEGVLQAMMMTKLRIAGVVVLAMGLTGLGVGGVWSAAAGKLGDASRRTEVPAGAAVEVKVPVAPAEKPREAVKQNDRGAAALELQARLNKPLGADVAFDPHTPLKEALGFLSDKFEIGMLIDEAAFQSPEGKINVGDQPVTLSTLKNPSLRTVLRLLLAQVPDGAYYIRSDFVEITTGKRIRSEILRADERPGRVWLALVHANFNRRPLQEALSELADLAEVNIVLDTRVGDKAKTEVTARLSNVAVDTAVQLLADMADLYPVTIDNVIYVTTAANADRLLAQQEKRKQTKPEETRIEKKRLHAQPDQ